MITLILSGIVGLVIVLGLFWSYQKGKSSAKTSMEYDTIDQYKRGIEASQRATQADLSPEEIVRKNDGKWK